MHLQQTKAGSLRSGGPQYFFHCIPEPIKDYLRRKGACDVVLMTPYGIASSPFMAVGRDHKLDADGRVVKGRVGHDRIQQHAGSESIGEAIRRWYSLPARQDFERIDINVDLHPEGHFIVSPVRARMRGKARAIDIRKPWHPLSFHADYRSPLWVDQIRKKKSQAPKAVSWAAEQVRAVLQDHGTGGGKDLHEADLLRAAGALSCFGMVLSAYRVKGMDWPREPFQPPRLSTV